MGVDLGGSRPDLRLHPTHGRNMGVKRMGHLQSEFPCERTNLDDRQDNSLPTLSTCHTRQMVVLAVVGAAAGTVEAAAAAEAAMMMTMMTRIRLPLRRHHRDKATQVAFPRVFAIKTTSNQSKVQPRQRKWHVHPPRGPEPIPRQLPSRNGNGMEIYLFLVDL